MRKQLVISRFNEDVSWVAGVGVPTLVYDKGELSPGGIPLPNVGYEAHTFLWHFWERYDELADITICLQGDPFPHLPGRRIDGLLAATSSWGSHFSFVPLFRHSSWQSRNGLPHHPGLGPFNEKVWKELLGRCPPEMWHTAYGGQFAVHRDLVTRRPRSFWKLAADLMQSKNDACAMERLWGSVFS